MESPVVELSQCVLCGICEEVSPSVFCINELGFVTVAELSVYPEDEVNEAVKNCPESCISWQ
jgi:ferredoxin